jgi:hypothetical protein
LQGANNSLTQEIVGWGNRGGPRSQCSVSPPIPAKYHRPTNVSVFLTQLRAAKLAKLQGSAVIPLPVLPAKPEPEKPKKVKVEHIPQSHLDFLETRAKLHVLELCTEFFPDGRLTDHGFSSELHRLGAAI